MEMSNRREESLSRKTVSSICIVCSASVCFESNSCNQLLRNVSVGQFLVNCHVVTSENFSLRSPICDECLHAVKAADNAQCIVDRALKLLTAKRDEAEKVNNTGDGDMYSNESGECRISVI